MRQTTEGCGVVVEHAFVTVIPVDTALKTVIEFLTARGFMPAEGSIDRSSGEGLQRNLELQRPAGKLARWTVILPQRLRLNYDRGRVTMALSISPETDWRNETDRSFFGGRPNARVVKQQTDLLITMACAVESLLADGRTPEECTSQWAVAETAMTDAAKETQRKLKRRKTILIVTVVAVAGALCGLAMSTT